jgi:hypothetical protein
MAARIPEWGPLLRSAGFGLDGALVGFMATGFFVTVLYYPFFWVNLAFTGALHEVTRRRYRKVRARSGGARMGQRVAPAHPTVAVARGRTPPPNGDMRWLTP